MSMGKQIYLPVADKNMVRWVPKLGDNFPDFQASTTNGPLQFYDWADGQWCFVFSHPAAFTAVCTTEIVALAAAYEDFAAREVKLLGFTASPLEDQRNWHHDILKKFGFHVNFPTVDDQTGFFARTFGMVHENESTSGPIRKSFVLDPKMRIRMIFEYPIYVGRSTDEVLRTIDALQAVDEHDVATPADWRPGQEYLCSEKHVAAYDAKIFGKRLRRLSPYLASVKAL